MKILLVNPLYSTVSGIKDSGGHSIPLNLAYIAAYTRMSINCTIRILDAETFGLTFTEIKQYIADFSPDIVGITCPTPSYNHVIHIAEIAKIVNPRIIVALGGPHPSAFPIETVSSPNVDFAIIGEGEVTFIELLNEISSERVGFKKIEGIAFKSNSGPVLNQRRKLIDNLDEIPFPARDLFQLDAYYSAPTKKVSKYPGTSIITSRGCPYDCIHCISKLIWQRKVRNRSVKNVVDEIEMCVSQYKIREFNFYDDTFTLNKNRVIDISREIQRRNLDIFWIAFGRVNCIDEEMVKEMKRAGCRKISFGLESGSQNILDTMRKNATIDMGKNAVRTVAQSGIRVHASFMIGNIGETAETIRETINYAKKLPLDNATFFITAPFPGTDLFEIARQQGFISSAPEWERFAPITSQAPILIQNNINHTDLIRWQKKAFFDFYVRPSYFFRKLQNIRSIADLWMIKEGINILLRILKKSLKGMSKSE